MATRKNKLVENVQATNSSKKPAKKTFTEIENKKEDLKKDIEKVVKNAKLKVEEVAKEIKEVTEEVKTKVLKKATTKKVPSKAVKKNLTTHVTFEIRFSTQFGQEMFIAGNHALLGNNDIQKAPKMNYLNSNAWNLSIDFNEEDLPATLSYYYFVKNADGSIIEEGLANKTLDLSDAKGKDVYVSDFWSFSGFPAGLFETKPFKVLLAHDAVSKKVKNATHIFTVKAPAVEKEQIVCLIGNNKSLGNWEVKNALELYPLGNGNWQIEVNLSKEDFPIEYKFGLLEKNTKKIIALEAYENRCCEVPAQKRTKIYINEGLINIHENA